MCLAQNQQMSMVYMKHWRETGNQVSKLNFDKCIVKLKSCSVSGEIYTPQGVKPDPNKVEAIKHLQLSKNCIHFWAL